MIRESLFYPEGLVQKARQNTSQFEWARQVHNRMVQEAEPWMRFSDDELWGLMFGNTLKRSWMVWSNGHCPACEEGVPMYNWQIDAINLPWKLRCPHCAEIFPKNDFYAFYQSGLDDNGIFDAELADRSLLFHADHPDPNDPLHRFGVDDGNGYRADGNIWWFVATYLIYGQWKQVVKGGICKLADAYTVTGDVMYAHKAGVMLDRVADLYPTFDFEREGVLYEKPAAAGYVSTWHDACEEARELFMAYDQVRDVLVQDQALANFLQEKAEQYQIEVSKRRPEDVMHNIEMRLVRDTIDHADKIRSNYPRQEIALIVAHTVLDWPNNRDLVMALIDEMVATSTAVDGVTGEKGLAGYASGVIQSLAQFLETFERVENGFLDEMLTRHPNLKQTYRFHLDTWYQQQYYPRVGDTGVFAQKTLQYVGVGFAKDIRLLPSMYSFLWRMYERTDDVGYVQALYRANASGVDGLPYDLFVDHPEDFQKAVQQVIDQNGTVIDNKSTNKADWHLALLRSGKGDSERLLWLDYDTGGRHGHADALNVGLFAKGLDLMPDFGYPPVHRGGWSGDLFDWYLCTAAHNTVVVDGKTQEKPVDGVASIWGVGKCFRTVRASCEGVYNIEKYARTLMMVDVSDSDSYVLDVFDVMGGCDHAKFMHSQFANVVTMGLTLEADDDYGYATQMRNFKCDLNPEMGWSVDWQVVDHYGYLKEGQDVHVRYTDMTTNAQAHLAEGWVALGFDNNDEAHIPRLMVRRQGEENLASTFVGVIEPYEGEPLIASVQRLPLMTPIGVEASDNWVAVEATLADGRRDLLIALCGADDAALVAWDLDLVGTMCWVRKDIAGNVTHVTLYGESVRVGDVVVKGENGFVEKCYI